MTKNITIPIRRVIRCDVVVVGGGTTGIAAALAAARSDASTLLIEANGVPGGNALSIYTWLGFYSRKSKQRLIGGIPREIAEKVMARAGAFPEHGDPYCSSLTVVDPEYLSIVATQELVATGVEVLLNTRFISLEKKDGFISHIYCVNAEGLLEIECREVIDATDTGTVASAAGEKLISGRAGDGRHQVSSLVFEIGGIDFNRLFDYFETVPEDIRPFPLEDPRKHLREIRTRKSFVFGAFSSLIQRAEHEGLKLPRQNFPGQAIPGRNKLISMGTRLVEVDPANSNDVIHATAEGMQQLEDWLTFLKKYVPGFEQCTLEKVSRFIGIRETSHLDGVYTLTANDLLVGRRFEDGIALGDYHLDIHSPDHGGIDTALPEIYSIPYQALLPKNTSNLHVAGRCLSATHEALSSLRVIPISMATGEAAGTAAGLALRGPVMPAELRKVLQRNHVLLEPVETA